MRIIKQTINQKNGAYRFNELDEPINIDTNDFYKQEELKGLIKQFAPILCLHADEVHQPVNVDWYLNEVHLIHTLTNQTIPFTPFQINSKEVNKEEHFLKLNTTLEQNSHSKKDAPKVYVHAKSIGNETIDLQYWFLFRGKGNNSSNIKWLVEGITAHQGAINLNPIGCQGGHWERITIRINHQSRLAEKVFLPNVKGGEWIPFERMQAKNQQVIAFVSKNNHSFYQSAGIKPIESLKFKLVSSVLEFSLFDECTIESILDFSDSCELISNSPPELVEINEPNWLNFKGKWGRPVLQDLNFNSVQTLLKEAFGADLVFLLGNNVLNELSSFLTDYHIKACKCKALGPKSKWCWEGNEED